jgi:hypothetical protein
MRKSGISFSTSPCKLPCSDSLFLHRFSLFFSAITFPESQARAEAVVSKTWLEDPTSDAAMWTIEEYVTALSARISYMFNLGKLPDASIRVLSNLWP